VESFTYFVKEQSSSFLKIPCDVVVYAYNCPLDASSSMSFCSCLNSFGDFIFHFIQKTSMEVTTVMSRVQVMLCGRRPH
jgi:hypothetical protein